MQVPSPSAALSTLGPGVRVRRVEAVVNAASGSVGPDPGTRLTAITTRYGLDVHVACVQPDELGAALRSAVQAEPDLLILVAGDGTAALAASLCGMDGPLLAPLPGGTMNMLPHALYGRLAWPEALDAMLSTGEQRTVSGGEVSGRPFYVAAILGAPALWAEAREALRKRKLRLAVLHARRALTHAFSGRLRFEFAGQTKRKAEALTLMCPLVSRAMDDDLALEAAALDPRGAVDAFRLGFRTLVGAWRDDPAVATWPCSEGRAWARGRIPVILDGEPHRLDSPVTIRFRPEAFRALVPPRSGDTEALANRQGDKTAADAAEGAALSKTAKSL